jgi:hypothetical protein
MLLRERTLDKARLFSRSPNRLRLGNYRLLRRHSNGRAHAVTALATSDLLVIDCRAASIGLFSDFFDEVGLSEVLGSFDARLTVVCPVNHEADSVEQLRILSDALHDRYDWVVVKNEARSESFKIYDGSKTRRHYGKGIAPGRPTRINLEKSADAPAAWARLLMRLRCLRVANGKLRSMKPRS